MEDRRLRLVRSVRGLAGVLLAARVNSAQPTLGFGYELDAISAVVIGGTSLAGGVGTILGTVIGAFIVKTLADGLQLVDVPQEWQIVATGVVVILAVYLDIVRRRGRESGQDAANFGRIAGPARGPRRQPSKQEEETR